MQMDLQENVILRFSEQRRDNLCSLCRLLGKMTALVDQSRREVLFYVCILRRSNKSSREQLAHFEGSWSPCAAYRDMLQKNTGVSFRHCFKWRSGLVYYARWCIRRSGRWTARWLKHLSYLVVQWCHRLSQNVLPVFVGAVCNSEKLLHGANELAESKEFVVYEVAWMGKGAREEGKNDKDKLIKEKRKEQKRGEGTRQKNSLGGHCYCIAQIIFHVVHCVNSHKSMMRTTEPISLQLYQGPTKTLVQQSFLFIRLYLHPKVHVSCAPFNSWAIYLCRCNF
jgi:hypothetical protein